MCGWTISMLAMLVFFKTIILQYNQIPSQSSNFILSHKIINFFIVVKYTLNLPF